MFACLMPMPMTLTIHCISALTDARCTTPKRVPPKRSFAAGEDGRAGDSDRVFVRRSEPEPATVRPCDATVNQKMRLSSAIASQSLDLRPLTRDRRDRREGSVRFRHAQYTTFSLTPFFGLWTTLFLQLYKGYAKAGLN